MGHRCSLTKRGRYSRWVTTPRRAPGGFPVVGIIGGGQLARMCAGPAAELGITLSVFAEAEDASAALVVPSSPVGDHTVAEAVHAFAQHCDVVTFDHEHVPAHVLDLLVAEGVELHPRPAALRFAQDKLAMRERLTELGIPCPRWTRADDVAEATAFGDDAGWPVGAKTPRGGYDGKGVRLAASADDLADWLERAATDGTGLLLEERVPFVRELAVLVARSPSGQAAAWPVVETVQTDGICTEVLAPAPGLDADLAADAVVLSSRGRRHLDRAPAPLRLLADVVAAVGDRCEVMIDTGVRTGADLVTAKAMGASAAMIGRAYLYGLMAGGEPGVDRALGILRAEFTRTLQLLGVTRAEDLGPAHVTVH